MNLELFLHRLLVNLPMLTGEERQQLIDYYTELVADSMENGKTEAEALAELGSPEEAARLISADYGEQQGSSKTAPQPACFAAQQPVRTVHLDVQSVKVLVRTGRVDLPCLHFEGMDEKDEVEFTEENGVFRFTQARPWSLRNLKSLFSHRLITLELPNGYAGILLVNSRNGAVRLDSLTARRVEVCASNGAATLEGIEASEHLRVQATNGIARAVRCCADLIDLHSLNGAVRTEDCASTTLNLHTANGGAQAIRTKASQIRLESRNGAVSAELYGSEEDYNVDARTVNGKSNLTSTFDAEKTCSLFTHTTNGRIDVQFIPAP